MIGLQYWFDFYHSSTWINHRYTGVASLLNLPPTSAHSHPSSLLQSPWLRFLSHIQIPIGYLFTYVSVYAPSTHLTLSLSSPKLVHKSVLRVHISTAALRIDSLVPSF